MRGARRALLSVVALVAAALPALAADSYAEYRIPEHYWRSWTANFNGSGNHEVSDLSTAGESRRGTLDGAVGTLFNGGFDSDSRSSAYFVSLVATGERVHSTEKHSDPFTSFDYTDRDRSAKEQLRASYSLTRYPWRAPLGLSLGTSDEATLSQSWVSTAHVVANPAAELHTTTNVEQGQSSTLLTLSAGVSWGRVRDATPVYQAAVLEQRLLEAGTIEHALSQAGRAGLASLRSRDGGATRSAPRCS